MGRLLGTPAASAAPRSEPRVTQPAPVTRPSAPAPVRAPDPAAWLPDDVTPDPAASLPEDVTPDPAASLPDDVTPDPAASLPDDVAPVPTPDEPAPVSSPEPGQPTDPHATRWLADEAPIAAVATTAPDVEPQHSQWLPEPAGAGGGRSVLSMPLATVDPHQLARSVGAYCNELLDTRLTPEATETILSRFHAASEQSHATTDELLRLTRKTTADYAHAPSAWRGATAAARREECRATPARLAARDGGTLARAARAELESHLDHCLSCQAIELRCRRAERAFATTLATRTLDEDERGPSAEIDGVVQPKRARRSGAARRVVAIAGAAVMLAACAAIALVLVRGGSHPQATTAVPASATSTPAPTASTKANHRVTKAKRHVVRRPSRTHKPAKHPKPRSGGGGASTAVASAPAGSSAASTAPASAAAPSAPAPAPAPAASSGSSGAGGSGGSAGGSNSSGGPVSVTQQGSGLPAQNAPTQGISSGGSAGSQH